MQAGLRLGRSVLQGLAIGFGLAALAAPASAGPAREAAPIPIVRQGAFEAGGAQLREGERTLSCDHGFVE